MRGILDEEVERDLGTLDHRDVEISGVSKGRVGKCLQFDAGTKVVDVPLSLIRGSEDNGASMTLLLPEWWAKKQGLIA